MRRVRETQSNGHNPHSRAPCGGRRWCHRWRCSENSCRRCRLLRARRNRSPARRRDDQTAHPWSSSASRNRGRPSIHHPEALGSGMHPRRFRRHRSRHRRTGCKSHPSNNTLRMAPRLARPQSNARIDHRSDKRSQESPAHPRSWADIPSFHPREGRTDSSPHNRRPRHKAARRCAASRWGPTPRRCSRTSGSPSARRSGKTPAQNHRRPTRESGTWLETAQRHVPRSLTQSTGFATSTRYPYSR